MRTEELNEILGHMELPEINSREDATRYACVTTALCANALNHWETASDCFCPDQKNMPDGYQNGGRMLAFVRMCVMDKLKDMGKDPETELNKLLGQQQNDN